MSTNIQVNPLDPNILKLLISMKAPVSLDFNQFPMLIQFLVINHYIKIDMIKTVDATSSIYTTEIELAICFNEETKYLGSPNVRRWEPKTDIHSKLHMMAAEALKPLGYKENVQPNMDSLFDD